METKSKILDLAVRVWAKFPPPLRQFYYRVNVGVPFGSFLLPDREEVVKITGGITKGMKMRFNLNRDRLYYFGAYEKDVQLVLAKFVTKDMTVFNIGANIGFHTLALTRLVGTDGLVVAFEPNPKVRDKLIENLFLNGLVNHVCVEEYAMSDFDGRANFSLSLTDAQGRFEDLPYAEPGASIRVPCKRLDTYVSERGCSPQFVLMDVEYAEGRVLRGMSRLLEYHKPFILVEMHGPDSILESMNELKRHRYFVSSIPDLEIVTNSERITRGHYLAAHASYLDGPWPPQSKIKASAKPALRKHRISHMN
jgi:FkbM family methyltransferase